jgi:hypothetical protein
MYRIEEVLNSLALADLIKIVNDNKWKEHDCDRETYINHIISNMYMNKDHRITLLYKDDVVIGYLISRYDNFIMNEVLVVDIYITKKHQGGRCIMLLLDETMPIWYKTGAKRVKWQSGVLGHDFWSKHSFNIPVESYEIFSVSFEGTEGIYKKSKEESK